MKENTILADIHMLATDKPMKAGQLVFDKKRNQLTISNFGLKVIEESITPQHLYATTNEEIKEKDWIIIIPENGECLKLRQCLEVNDKYIVMIGEYSVFKKNCKKIVATTNPELWNFDVDGATKENRPLYPLPTTFLQPYVDAYNSGKPIKQVLLQMEDIGGEEWMGDNENGEPFWHEVLRLKLKPNGSVIIHPVVEKTYTRDEVTIMIHSCATRFGNMHVTHELVNTWFETNYP